METKETIKKETWKGKSGEKYLFEVYPITYSFKEDACVYIYTKILEESKIYVKPVKWDDIYVGETIHLATRLKEHANKKSKNKSDKLIQESGATYIHVHKLESRDERLEMEKDLRENYKWRCNQEEKEEDKSR
jgi:predicted GIY-YIG superfamily endonuclease